MWLTGWGYWRWGALAPPAHRVHVASSLCAPLLFLSESNAPVTDIAINPNKCDKIDYEHAGVISPAQLPLWKKWGITHTHVQISGCVPACVCVVY